MGKVNYPTSNGQGTLILYVPAITIHYSTDFHQIANQYSLLIIGQTFKFFLECKEVERLSLLST